MEAYIPSRTTSESTKYLDIMIKTQVDNY